LISVNEQPLAWRENLSVSELLKICKYSFPLIIVKINGEIVAKSEYEKFMVPDGANVSVIHLMSGG